MAELSPYLTFEGNCNEAMNFYHKCLGGELKIQKVAETPMVNQMPPEYKDQVMHSVLNSNGFTIMASDMRREKVMDGNTIGLCFYSNNEEEINRFFSKLAVGGKIIEPMKEQFWGAIYGELIDKYGKRWMFNYEKVKQ